MRYHSFKYIFPKTCGNPQGDITQSLIIWNIFSGMLNMHDVQSTDWELNLFLLPLSLTDLRLKLMRGKLNQVPHHSLNGVSRRKLSRPAAREEGGSRGEAAVPSPSTSSVALHRNTSAPDLPAQQLCLQETESWKGAQEQVLRYHLAGQDQMLLLCGDLRRERQRLQDQHCLGEENVNLGLSQEKAASCRATEVFCLHSVRSESVQAAVIKKQWGRLSWKSCSEYF